MLTAIDAFAGAGGLSLGLISAGYDVRFAFDVDPIAVETYRVNISTHAEELDASRVTGAELLARLDMRAGELSLLAGGPPCQGFSMQGRGDPQDVRNQLVLRYLDWLTVLRPRAFLIENVPTIRGVRGRAVIDAVETHATSLGYRLHSTILNAVDYGVPQRRKRAFLIGLLDAGDLVWPSTAPTPVRTVFDAISDLPSPPRDGSPHQSVANHYREARLSKLNIERIQHVPQGGGREHLPEHLRLACHRDGHRHLDTYGRLAWDEPAVTITARFDSFTRGRFGHPVEDRSITLREGARLQSFPDSFVFLGNREQGARLIGNAVPPLLGQVVAEGIAAALVSPLDLADEEAC